MLVDVVLRVGGVDDERLPRASRRMKARLVQEAKPKNAVVDTEVFANFWLGLFEVQHLGDQPYRLFEHYLGGKRFDSSSKMAKIGSAADRINSTNSSSMNR